MQFDKFRYFVAITINFALKAVKKCSSLFIIMIINNNRKRKHRTPYISLQAIYIHYQYTLLYQKARNKFMNDKL